MPLDAALLVLSLTDGLGPRSALRLLEAFGSASEALAAPAAAWRRQAGVRGALHAAARRTLREGAAQATLELCERLGISLLGLGDPAYPPLLAAIADPPPVLYLRGRLPPPSALERAVAIVGTRDASEEGRAFAHRLARDLAAAGVVIVSGLALGIDAEAHRGTLAAQGAGIAVLPTGLDGVYPRRHRSLARELEERGALVSEHPPGGELHRGHFVGRNRVVSGLARALVVVEAPARSGALTTAAFAAEQGRTVFAAPTRPDDRRGAGCLGLLRDGAALVTDASDVAAEISVRLPAPGSLLPPPLAGLHALLAQQGAAGFDSLQGATGLPAAELAAALSRLELDGLVRRGDDGRYYRLG